jgi:hypothetical protein
MTRFKNPITPEETDLISRVEEAALATMKTELEILKNGKVERTFTSCFANEIGQRIRLANIRSDPFYNKHHGAAKYLDRKLIELDIAVHERNKDENNLIAIELETSNNPTRDDMWKIEGLTQELGGYGYKLGLYVVFGVSKKAGQIIAMEWFRNSSPL